MQPHDQHDPAPKEPNPQDGRTKWWLHLVIAILLGLIASQLFKRVV